ncbi:MAG: penicillin-binding protein activator [Pseudomonadota bacterium]
MSPRFPIGVAITYRVPAIIPRCSLVHLLGIATLLLTLAGCSTPDSAPSAPAAPVEGGLQPDSDRARAQQLLAAAARERAGGDAGRALQLYRQIEPNALGDAARADYLLGYADAALQEGEVLLARELLTAPAAAPDRFDATQRQRWLRLRGELFGLLGDTSQSLSAYIELADSLPGQRERAEVEQAIWGVLRQTPTPTLTRLAAQASDPRLHGWYQLALAGRQAEPAPGAAPAVAAPGASIRILAPAEVPALRRVALLLPESGAYATAAGILRDGFLGALFAARAAGAATPDVRIYDTAAADVLTLYEQAVAEGAELVIGPLEPELVSRLRDRPERPVPVLSLNYLESDPGPAVPNFYQFGLSVAAEAEAAAHAAWRDGRRAALALAPDTGWGNRALRAFRDTFRALGGEVRGETRYDMALKDFTPVLRPLLAPRPEDAAAPDAGEPPRRRADIDMVFLVAYPTQGRQIKPTLEFLYAGDLPVYATSAIYSGTPDPARDRDLGDIRFSASPWALADPGQLAPSPDHRLPPAHRQLFALGVDSYLVHARLAGGPAGFSQPIPGQTGLLILDGAGRIQRQQPWAQFRDGLAALLASGEAGR